MKINDEGYSSDDSNDEEAERERREEMDALSNLWGLIRGEKLEEMLLAIKEKPKRMWEQDWNGWDLFHWCCWYDKPNMADALLTQGSDFRRRTKKHWTALHLCCYHGGL